MLLEFLDRFYFSETIYPHRNLTQNFTKFLERIFHYETSSASFSKTVQSLTAHTVVRMLEYVLCLPLIKIFIFLQIVPPEIDIYLLILYFRYSVQELGVVLDTSVLKFSISEKLHLDTRALCSETINSCRYFVSISTPLLL
jgi:hypothetical protein